MIQPILVHFAFTHVPAVCWFQRCLVEVFTPPSSFYLGLVSSYLSVMLELVSAKQPSNEHPFAFSADTVGWNANSAVGEEQLACISWVMRCRHGCLCASDVLVVEPADVGCYPLSFLPSLRFRMVYLSCAGLPRGIYPKGGWESNLPHIFKSGAVDRLVILNNLLRLIRQIVACKSEFCFRLGGFIFHP